MEEGVSAPILSRKELRKQKLMEYLTAKGKLKPAKSYVYDGSQERNGTKEAVMGKENKIPADGVSNYSKVQTAQPSQTSPRRAFGVTKSLQKVSTQTGGKNALHPPSKSTGLQPKPNRNPALARTYTVTSSKSNLTAVKQPKKQPNAQTQVTAKAPSNTGNRVGAKSTSKSSLNSNTAVSYPVKGLTVRLSVGPFVKTKTGLIPAMIQPRNTKSNSTQPSASAARATITTPAAVAAKRTHSNTTSLVPQRSAAAISATRRTENKVPVQIKIKSKPVKPVQLTSEGQLSSGLRQTSSSFKCKAEPQGRVLTNKAAFRFENGSRRARPGAEEDKTAQAHKTVPQTSSRTASRFKSRAVTTVKQTVSTERGGKTETSKETFSKIENSSRNILTRPKVAARMSQTAPQPCRTISLTNRATDTKTPRVTVVPQTEGKKLTAAQEERLKKLQEWREAKGISYKRPPMPVKAPVRRTISVPQPYWASMKAEDDAHSVISAVDRSLADCIKLLAEGCPADQVKGVLSRLPAVSHKFAKYWICQARLMEQEGNLDVLPMFEEAVRVVLEPVDELRTVVFDIMKKKDEAQVPEDKEKEEDHTLSEEQTEEEECNSSPMVTPKPVRVLISGEKGDSSAVKYKITLTPGGPLSQQAEPVKVNGQEVRFFTPVRRSVRIERASLHYPAFLQDHDACVTSYGDLISEEVADNSHERSGGDASTPVRDTLMYIYRENEALKDKVFVEFECDDGV